MRLHRLFFVIVSVICLMGCTTPDYSHAVPTPQIGFSHLNPYLVKGGTTLVMQSFQSDKRTFEVAQEFGQTPAQLLKSYAQKRFVTNSDRALKPTFVFDVKKAKLSKITEQTDPLMFMTGLSMDQYKVEISLALSELDAAGQKLDPHTLYYEQVLTVSSNVTLSERDNAQFEFYEKVISDLDRAISDIVANKLF